MNVRVPYRYKICNKKTQMVLKGQTKISVIWNYFYSTLWQNRHMFKYILRNKIQNHMKIHCCKTVSTNGILTSNIKRWLLEHPLSVTIRLLGHVYMWQLDYWNTIYMWQLDYWDTLYMWQLYYWNAIYMWQLDHWDILYVTIRLLGHYIYVTIILLERYIYVTIRLLGHPLCDN
jgi:hypothetical protein